MNYLLQGNKKDLEFEHLIMKFNSLIENGCFPCDGELELKTFMQSDKYTYNWYLQLKQPSYISPNKILNTPHNEVMLFENASVDNSIIIRKIIDANNGNNMITFVDGYLNNNQINDIVVHDSVRLNDIFLSLHSEYNDLVEYKYTSNTNQEGLSEKYVLLQESVDGNFNIEINGTENYQFRFIENLVCGLYNGEEIQIDPPLEEAIPDPEAAIPDPEAAIPDPGAAIPDPGRQSGGQFDFGSLPSYEAAPANRSLRKITKKMDYNSIFKHLQWKSK